LTDKKQTSSRIWLQQKRLYYCDRSRTNDISWLCRREMEPI